MLWTELLNIWLVMVLRTGKILLKGIHKYVGDTELLNFFLKSRRFKVKSIVNCQKLMIWLFLSVS